MINRDLFVLEMRRNLKSLVLWSVVIGALIFFTMSFFRTVVGYQQQISGMFQMVPVMVIKMRGFSNFNDIFSVMGFYTANNIIYMMLIGSIFGTVLSGNILLKEEYGKTAEYLMSRPIMRTEIFLTKITVAFLNIFILNVLAAVISYIAIRIYKNGPFRVEPFLVLTLYTFLLNLLFGAIGLFISVIIKRARPVTFFCVGLVLVFYFINTISKMAGVEGSFGYLSPFKWVDVDVLSPAYGFDMLRITTFILVTALFIAISGFIYRRKDILI